MELEGIIISNRFKIDARIADGRLSSVYIARDLTDNEKPAAVKFLKNNVISTRVEDFIRYRTALNAVRKLNHPNIVKIHDAGEIMDLHYIVMEYVRGKSLLRLITPGGVSPEKGVQYSLQLCRALEYIHKLNITHRDLRPGNILIDGDTVKLSDFGLVNIKDFTEHTPQEDLKDIFCYISPEQSGMIKKAVDERSDLYTLGVIMYQLFTGRLPFEGNDINTIIHQQIARIPEAPGNLNPQVPEILDRIVLKLLEKEPENRYQSASGLFFDLEKFSKGQREFILGLNEGNLKLSYRTRLVGRDRELGRLKNMFSQALWGRGGIGFITGEAGRGKTRLTEEFRDHIFSLGRPFISGICPVQKSKVPYGPFKEALSSYIKIFRNYNETRKKEIAKRIRENFRGFGEIIIKLNSGMRDLLGDFPPMVSLEPEGENKRFHMIASRFFRELSDIENGLVLAIENLQWSDEGTLNLLDEILDDIPEHPLLIIGTFREDELAKGHSLNRLVENIKSRNICFEEMALDVFDSRMMNRFISGLLGEPENNTEDISGFILGKTGGNPFFAIEMLQHLVEEGELYYDSKWIIKGGARESIDVPGTIVDVILKRIKLLESGEKKVLSCAAVAGEKFDIDLLVKLSGLESTDVVGIVDRAIALHILVELQDVGRLGFVHDRIKEAFYYSLDDIEKKDLHIKAASALLEEHRGNPREAVFQLFHHFYEGGDIERSIDFAYPAGLKAKENYANEEAAKYFKLALDFMKQGSPRQGGLRIDILKGLSDVYLILGNYDEAIEILHELLPYMESDADKADINSQICSAYFKKGDWILCEEYGRRGLKLLGERLPVTRGALITALSKELFVHLLHYLLPWVFVRKKKYPRGREGIRYMKMGRIYLALIWSYVLSDNLKFFVYSLRVINKAERYIGKSMELGMALGAYGSLCMAIPLFRRAVKYHEKAIRLREELKDEWGVAQSCQWMGYCYEWKGEYKKAIEYFDRCVLKFREIGDVREYGMSLCGKVLNYFYVADYNNSRTANEEYYKISKRSRDNFEMSTSWLISLMGLIERGDLENSEDYALNLRQLCRDNEIWFIYCISSIKLGELFLLKNDIEKSIGFLEEARELYKKHNFLKQHTVYLYTALAEAYLARASADKDLHKMEIKLYHKKIKKSCKEAMIKTRSWVTWHGAANRVNARYYSFIGKNKKAEKFFKKSIEIDTGLGRRFELARSYYEYGLFLLRTDRFAESKMCLEAAFQVFSDIGSNLYMEKIRGLLGFQKGTDQAESMSELIHRERFLALASAVEEIRQIQDMDDLLSQVLKKSIGLTGAERGAFYLVNESGVPEIKCSVPGTGSFNEEFSMCIARDVFEKEKSLVIEDVNERPGLNMGGNIMPGNIKSVMGVPVKERGKTIGVCYLDNSLSRGVFTEKAADMQMSFFSQVAFVIENVLLLQQFRALQDSPKSNAPAPGSRNERIKRVEDKIKKAIEYINENYSSDISREGLAAYIDIHPDNLSRYFKLYLGKKMSEYINELRIKEAVEKLSSSDANIADIAFSVGFESLRTFNRAFIKFMKETPANYRNRYL